MIFDSTNCVYQMNKDIMGCGRISNKKAVKDKEDDANKKEMSK